MWISQSDHRPVAQDGGQTRQHVAADRRMLIDGELVEAAATFAIAQSGDRRGPRTCPRRRPSPTPRAAVAAARRAFDTGAWATDVELRVRCLEQFHRALVEHRDGTGRADHRRGRRHRRALTQGAQLDQPIEIVRYYADLLKTYPMTEDLGNIESRGMQHHRWVEKEAAGVVAAIIAYNYPNQLALAKLGAGTGGRLHRRAQGRAGHPAGHAGARRADRQPHRHPGRRRQRAQRRGPAGRRRADHRAPTSTW